MRRALRVLQQAGVAQDALALKQQQQVLTAAPGMVRGMAGDAAPADNPLSKIMPQVVAVPRQVLNGVIGLTGQAVVAAAGMASPLVKSFGDRLCIEGSVANLKDVDTAYWAYWLAETGYDNVMGFRKLAEASIPKVADMDATQVTNLVTGLHKVRVYDKALFQGVAANIGANFTKFDTEQMVAILKAFADNDHFTVTLFDDAADCITYCNHYLAPVKLPTTAIVDTLAAYAKFRHDRGDLFVALCRGISEVGLSKLSAADRKAAVVTGLKALTALNFYPEQVDAMLYYTKTDAGAFSADELKLADEVVAAVEAQTGGSLQTYEYSHDEDATHWYGHHQAAPSQYELYVFRESLVPESYSPVALRPKKQ